MSVITGKEKSKSRPCFIVTMICIVYGISMKPVISIVYGKVYTSMKSLIFIVYANQNLRFPAYSLQFQNLIY